MMTTVYMAEKYHKLINNHEELAVYKIVFETGMTIFEIAQIFPNVEKKLNLLIFPLLLLFPPNSPFPYLPICFT